MTLEVTVVCDGCGIIGAGALTGYKARRELEEQGWLVGLPGGRDLCPECHLKPSPANLPSS